MGQAAALVPGRTKQLYALRATGPAVTSSDIDNAAGGFKTSQRLPIWTAPGGSRQYEKREMTETTFRNLDTLKKELSSHEDIEITPQEAISMFREMVWDRRFKELYGIRGHQARYSTDGYGNQECISCVHYGDAPAGKWSLIVDYSPDRLRICNGPVDVMITTRHASHVSISLSSCHWFDVHFHFNRKGTDFMTLCFFPEKPMEEIALFWEDYKNG